MNPHEKYIFRRSLQQYLQEATTAIAQRISSVRSLKELGLFSSDGSDGPKLLGKWSLKECVADTQKLSGEFFKYPRDGSSRPWNGVRYTLPIRDDTYTVCFRPTKFSGFSYGDAAVAGQSYQLPTIDFSFLTESVHEKLPEQFIDDVKRRKDEWMAYFNKDLEAVNADIHQINQQLEATYKELLKAREDDLKDDEQRRNRLI